MTSAAKPYRQMTGTGADSGFWERPIFVRFAPASSRHMDTCESSCLGVAAGANPEAESRRLTAFDAALAELTPRQRRVLRLLLTGARVSLVAEAACEYRGTIARWLGAERVYLGPLSALHADLGPPAKVDLHEFVIKELSSENDEGIEAEAWATLAVVRAVGRLDANQKTLANSSLREEGWSTERP